MPLDKLINKKHIKFKCLENYKTENILTVNIPKSCKDLFILLKSCLKLSSDNILDFLDQNSVIFVHILLSFFCLIYLIWKVSILYM